MSNPKTCKLINKQGWMAQTIAMEPEKVAKIAMSALFQGKKVIVPGSLNKILLFLFGLLPTTLYIRIFGGIYRKVSNKNLQLSMSN
jgi:short-subunit dehydrogenase